MKHIKRFNEEFDPMGSWDPKHNSNKNIITTNDIREELTKKMKNTSYDVGGILYDRITQLLKIHKTWLNRVILTETLDSIVDSLLKYEKNLNNGLGPLSQK